MDDLSLKARLSAHKAQFRIDPGKANGDPARVLPMPARFIVDREPIIRYAQYDPDHTVRPGPEHTLAGLKPLVGE